MLLYVSKQETRVKTRGFVERILFFSNYFISTNNNKKCLIFPMHCHNSLVRIFRSNMLIPQTFETLNVPRLLTMLMFIHLFLPFIEFELVLPLLNPTFSFHLGSLHVHKDVDIDFEAFSVVILAWKPLFFYSFYPHRKFYHILKKDILLQLNNNSNILPQPTNKLVYSLLLGFYQFKVYH